MYEFIKGTVHQINIDKVILESNQMGYRIYTLKNSLAEKHIGEEVFLYLTFVIRENLQQLFGFLEQQQQQLFDLLLTVSGIGPKVALGILSNISVKNFINAIFVQDAFALVKLPGLGKKTAEKVILELRDKTHLFPQVKQDTACTNLQDAEKALIELGFSPMKAEKAVKHLKEKLQTNDTETLVAQALKLKN